MNTYSESLVTIDLKTKVVLESFCDSTSIEQLAQKYELPIPLIIKWKREFMLEINHEEMW